MTETENRNGLAEALRNFHDTCERVAYARSPAGAQPAALSEWGLDGILMALIRCILPLEHPGFPFDAEAMLVRVKDCLAPGGLWDAATRLALARFDATDSLAQVWVPALAEERRVLEAYPANTPEKIQRQLESKRIVDERLLKRFSKKHGADATSFREMDPAAGRDYFWAWSQSGFGLKRRFHRACRDAVAGSAVAAPEFRSRGGL
jgi:hypothetical protein